MFAILVGMDIIVTAGKGEGKTLLSSFDAALQDAGVANYNLIQLSSIIPPHATIKLRKYITPPEEYGHKLYVVKAEMRSRESGKYIGAALGWYQLPDGKGVFVEHSEIGESEEAVKLLLTNKITYSLKDLCHFRQYPIHEGDLKMKLSVMKVTNAPATTLILAVYQAESWKIE